MDKNNKGASVSHIFTKQIGQSLDAIQHELTNIYVKLNGCNRTSVQTLLSTARQKILIARAVLVSTRDLEEKSLLPTIDDALAARLGSIALRAGLKRPGISNDIDRGELLRQLLEDENLFLVDTSQPTPSFKECEW